MEIIMEMGMKMTATNQPRALPPSDLAAHVPHESTHDSATTFRHLAYLFHLCCTNLAEEGGDEVWHIEPLVPISYLISVPDRPRTLMLRSLNHHA